MKFSLVLFICISSFGVYGQDVKTEFDGHKWKPPYYLPTPPGWTIERFLIPIAFAPEISYKGVEDIRFAPGWGNASGEEYWSYAFLWYLDGVQDMHAKMIGNNLKVYYTGLLKINTDPAKFKTLSEKERQVNTSFKQIKTNKGDLKTFMGTIEMLDYMQLKRIMLNCMVHVKTCQVDNKTVVFYELSPKVYTNKIWTSFTQLWRGFTCTK